MFPHFWPLIQGIQIKIHTNCTHSKETLLNGRTSTKQDIHSRVTGHLSESTQEPQLFGASFYDVCEKEFANRHDEDGSLFSQMTVSLNAHAPSISRGLLGPLPSLPIYSWNITGYKLSWFHSCQWERNLFYCGE